jgi:hypothetical protein
MIDLAARWMLPSPIAAGAAASSFADTAPKNSGRLFSATGAANPSNIARSAGVSISGIGRGS